MVFTPKNPAVATSTTIQPTGAIAYWRSTPVKGDPFLDLGYVVVTNRAKSQTTFDVLGNREGTEQLLKRIIKSSAESITLYSKNNTDSDIQALHSGSPAVTGAAGTGIAGVVGFTDTAAPAIGEFLLVGKSPDPTALIQIAWLPYAQITGSGEASEDILRYPQFDVTNLAWAANFKTLADPTIQAYITAVSAVKVGLLVPPSALDSVLTAIQNGGAAGFGYTPAPGGTTFAPNAPYVQNAKVNPSNTVATPYQYNVTTAGNSGATEPVWPTAPGSTVVSGTVTFTRV